MNIIQCKMCRRPFQSLGGKICPACTDKIEEDFVKVRDYIYDNPGSTSVDEISEKTEVSKDVILHLLKEGRLITDDSVVIEGGLVCEMCRRPIITGKLCGDCKKRVSETIQKSIDVSGLAKEQNEKRDITSGGSRMHSVRK